MDILEQFLHSIAYKFPKGYPDLKNKQDMLLIERELFKHNIDLREGTKAANTRKAIDSIVNSKEGKEAGLSKMKDTYRVGNINKIDKDKFLEILKGKNKYYLIAKNNDGVESSKSNDYNFDFDDKKPEIKSINISNGQEIRNLNKNINIIGETNEPTDIEINGKKVFKKDGNKFEYLLGVSEGEVKIEIKLVDKAGNETKVYYSVSYKKD
jgi:hypothetical protein